MPPLKKSKSSCWVDTDDAFGDLESVDDKGVGVVGEKMAKRKRINNNTIKSALR